LTESCDATRIKQTEESARYFFTEKMIVRFLHFC
jgi:hypothetical protein